LPQLKKIEKGFLYKNQSLKTLTLSLPQLNQVGGGFLFKCHQLKSVDLRPLLKLENVEVDRFMEGMPNLENVLIDLRQEELFNKLLKDKPNLRSEFMIA
ncbi:MAG: hypothetical protein C0582_01880, partial [Alphaproteobacteria bacterium]